MPVGLPLGSTPQTQVVPFGIPPLLLETAVNYANVARSGAFTIPAGSAALIVMPQAGRTFSGDIGVAFSSNGTPLTRCAAVQTGQADHTLVSGEYTYIPQTGTYYFAGADAGLGVQISYTDTDGSGNANWAVSSGGVQLGGGSMPFLPGDSIFKLLYQLRGTVLEALRHMTVAQAFPPASSYAPGTQKGAQQLPSVGASLYVAYSVDAFSMLPSNPANVGL
jgi:hypothetical protein